MVRGVSGDWDIMWLGEFRDKGRKERVIYFFEFCWIVK